MRTSAGSANRPIFSRALVAASRSVNSPVPNFSTQHPNLPFPLRREEFHPAHQQSHRHLRLRVDLQWVESRPSGPVEPSKAIEFPLLRARRIAMYGPSRWPPLSKRPWNTNALIIALANSIGVGCSSRQNQDRSAWPNRQLRQSVIARPPPAPGKRPGSCPARYSGRRSGCRPRHCTLTGSEKFPTPR